MKIAKIIKHYSHFYGKTVFLVEHDIIMATSISNSVILFEGEPGVSCIARKPIDLKTGINQFLQLMNITMRKGFYSNRPRINKFNCRKDREQKSISEKIAKLSFHSVVKKSNRIGMRLSNVFKLNEISV